MDTRDSDAPPSSCCSGCTPVPPPVINSCADTCCSSELPSAGPMAPIVEESRETPGDEPCSAIPASCADSSLEPPEHHHTPEPKPTKSGCCIDGACAAPPAQDDCCASLAPIDECCGPPTNPDACCSSPNDTPCCPAPCCADPLPAQPKDAYNPARLSQSALYPPRPNPPTCCSPSPSGSTTRTASRPASSTYPILSESGRVFHTPSSLSARCYDAMCCCARSMRERLLGHAHRHAYHPHAHGHLHKHEHGHGHDHDHPDHDHHGIEVKEAAEDDVDDSPGRRELVLSVLGMDCPSCSPRVVRALTSMPSVANCTVDVFAGRAKVTYHPDHVQPKDMARNVTASTGFKCDVIEDRVVGETQDGVTMRRMRVQLGRPLGEKGFTIRGTIVREEPDGIIEVEYEENPRDVLAALAAYDPTYLPPAPASQTDSAQQEVVRLFKLTAISAVLCVPVLVLAWAPLPPRPTIYGGVSLGLTTLIQAHVARPIYVSGIRALMVQRTIDMDLLVALSTGTAYLFSTVAYVCGVVGKPIRTSNGEEESYFETAALLVTLVMLGRLIAAYARRRSTNATSSLGAMQASTATLVEPSGALKVLPVGLIHVGDILRVRSGERVPTDGRVERGEAYVDESAITGESAPVAKRAGAVLIAGTTVSGELDMSVTLAPDANTLSRMGELMRAAQGARLRVQDTADRVAGWLAPVVLVLGLVVFVAWIGVGIRQQESAGAAVVKAIGYAVAVLVVSCPCAIALCVPMVAVIAVAVGTRRGVLFKTVEALESTCGVEVVVFDKTGTLTLGKLTVESAAYYPSERGLTTEGEIQGLVRALTGASTHPVSAAVHEHVIAALGACEVNICVDDIKVVPGMGIEATVGGVVVRGGSATWAGGEGLGGENTVFVVSMLVQTRFVNIAHFTLSDSLRPDSLETVRMLTQRGIEVHVLSGDMPRVVARTVAELGIPSARARGGCTPEGKGQWIRFLQEGGLAMSSDEKTCIDDGECGGTGCGQSAPLTSTPKRRKVMFVGDGTNDALALVQADVGVSLGGGTDVASSAAQIVLLSSLHSGLLDVFSLAKAARRRVWINFGWAAVYNLVAILLASGVLGRARIPPEYAGLGELVSVLPVVIVAWSLGVVGW